MNKKRAITITLISILSVVLVVCFFVLAEINGMWKNEKEVKIVIPKGAAAYDVAEILEKNDLIGNKKLYYLYAKITKPEYLYGVHKFTAKGYLGITEQLCTDKNIEELSVTFPEGAEMKEIAELLDFWGLTTEDEFYKAAVIDDYDYWFLKNLPNRDESLEGYLFPDTYSFSGTENAHEIIDKMLKNFDNHITSEMKITAENSKLSFDDYVILASIIEREASNHEEFAKVSGVFHNRLNNVGESNGYLQSCATVQYILKERKAVLSIADTQIDSEYNTYKYPGLPVGPISSPGLKALEAAFYPETTDYLYFVADGNGNHYFARDYKTHEENMKKAGL